MRGGLWVLSPLDFETLRLQSINLIQFVPRFVPHFEVHSNYVPQLPQFEVHFAILTIFIPKN